MIFWNLKIEVVNTNQILGVRGCDLHKSMQVYCVSYSSGLLHIDLCVVDEIVLVIYKYIEGFNRLLHTYIKEENV